MNFSKSNSKSAVPGPAGAACLEGLGRSHLPPPTQPFPLPLWSSADRVPVLLQRRKYLSIFFKMVVSCSSDPPVAARMTCTAGQPCLQPTRQQLPDPICCCYLLFLNVERICSSSLGSLERAFPVQYFISLGPVFCLDFPCNSFMLLRAKPLLRDWTRAAKSDYLAEAWQQSGSPCSL